LNSGGLFTSTTQRLRKGIALNSGMSTASDMKSGGASFSFFRIRKRGYSGGGIYLKSRNFAREAVSYEKDMFGEQMESSLKKRMSKISQYKDQSQWTASDETIFKNGVDVINEIDYIVAADNEDRLDIIKSYVRSGWTTLPDGRKVEDIVFTPITVEGGVKKLSKGKDPHKPAN